VTSTSGDPHPQVLILGAGFGGLEVATRLSRAVPDAVDVMLIDQSDGFTFGFSKLEVMFGRRSPSQVRHAYSEIDLPGVEFRRERVTGIEPGPRRVITDRGSYQPDVLVVALGADYDHGATPGFAEDGFDFYAVSGAERLAARLATFEGGDIVVAILGVPFKCPPAPYEAVLLLHDYLVHRGVRDRTRIEVITPMPSPIPVSAMASEAITRALAERDVVYTPGRLVRELDPANHIAHLKDETRRYDLFIGVPVHRVPEVVATSGLTVGGGDGWVAVDHATLATPFPGIYAVGDCADAPVPRAGVFAESAARVVAEQIIATVRGDGHAVAPYDGTGVCYLEFGNGTVGKVDGNFLGGPQPLAEFRAPTLELAAEKAAFASERRQRWFGATAGT
jgi:sulfide:quinone oxidoreductase